MMNARDRELAAAFAGEPDKLIACLFRLLGKAEAEIDRLHSAQTRLQTESEQPRAKRRQESGAPAIIPFAPSGRC